MPSKVTLGIKNQLQKYRSLVLLKRFAHRISRLQTWLDILQFIVSRRLRVFSVSTRPCFDYDNSADWFVEKLRNSNMYLEYGSGGSTYSAAKLKKPFITIDSDKLFLQAVKKKIIEDGLYNENSQTYCYANIGFTKTWGYPLVIFEPTKRRLESFSKYSDFPDKTLLPDLILIDGRFRVACALKAIKTLRNYSDWTLIVDDYVGRSYYSVIERFAKLDRIVDLMAIFVKLPQVDDNQLIQTIKQYEHDPR